MAGDRAQFRMGFETREGVPGSESWFAKFESETLSAMAPTVEPSPNIDSSGNEQEGRLLKLEGSGQISAVPNSEAWLPMRAHHHGFYTVEEVEAGVMLWELRDFDEVDDTPVPHYLDSMFLGVWKEEDTQPAEWFANGFRVSEFELTTDANDYIRWNHTGLFLRDRWVKAPEAQVPDATFDGRVEVRGHDDQDADYRKFKFTTGGALDGTAQIQWGLGAAAYAGPSYPVVAREWIDAHKPDGSLAGPDGLQLQIYFDDDATETIALNTEYRIYPQAPKPVAVYSARPDMTAITCEVRLRKNGVTSITRVIEGGVSLQMGRPREAKFQVGSLFAGRIGKPADSKKWWNFSFNTTYNDREIAMAMYRGTPFELFVKVRGALIGSTGEYDFSSFLLPAMRVTGGGANVGTAGDLPENPTFRAFPETQGASLCIEQHQNTVVDIDPTTIEGT